MSEQTEKYEGLRNMWGNLQPDIIARLERFEQEPTQEHWDDIAGIILTEFDPKRGTRGLTVWQAWIAIDPAAPTTGPVSNSKGEQIAGWPKIPDVFTYRRVLRFAQGKLSTNISR